MPKFSRGQIVSFASNNRPITIKVVDIDDDGNYEDENDRFYPIDIVDKTGRLATKEEAAALFGYSIESIGGRKRKRSRKTRTKRRSTKRSTKTKRRTTKSRRR